jgi:hypothetical protein
VKLTRSGLLCERVPPPFFKSKRPEVSADTRVSGLTDSHNFILRGEKGMAKRYFILTVAVLLGLLGLSAEAQLNSTTNEVSLTLLPGMT